MIICIGGFLLPANAPASEPVVPELLAPWVDWVLYDEADLDCPQLGTAATDRICDWPGTLSVEANNEGARFTMQLWLARPGTITLPGGDQIWPQNILVDERPAVLQQSAASEQARPAVHLDAGAHRLSGEFYWRSIPQYIPAPPDIGRITLQLNETTIHRPRLDEAGRLWLDSDDGLDNADESDRVRASIYRRIEDGNPMRIVTRIDVNVSGKAREIDMGRVFIEGSRPTSIDSPLPVEVAADGAISVYARPGTHRVIIEAVISEEVPNIAVPEPDVDFYDPQEVWVWVPDNIIRTAEVAGLRTIDPARTSLPEDWRGHTTFLGEPLETLQFKITQRGVAASPNALNLNREIWFDIEANGLTIRDQLSGSMQRDWRLDYAGPAELGRVYSQHGGDDMLITKDPRSGRSGVEIRDSAVNITADLRLHSASTVLPAVSWDHDIQQLSTTLHLPPGWSLLSASGVDSVSGEGLVDSWTLWDFFFLLMVALAIGKLLGWRWAPVAVFGLLLSHGYTNAPMWTWIHLVASLALLRALPDGLWRKGVHVYRVLTLLILFVLLATFAHDQIHTALHPQVDTYRSEVFTTDRFVTIQDEVSSVNIGRGYSDMASGANERSAAPSRQKQQMQLSQIDPNAVVQTGPGLPTWNWNQWRLNWNGPVHRDHEIRLWLVSPNFNRLLTLFRIALLLVLALVLLSPKDMAWRKREKNEPPTPGDKNNKNSKNDTNTTAKDLWRFLTRASLILLVGGLVSLSTTTAEAQQTPDSSQEISGEPTRALLQTLRQRLVEARTCDGPCVVVSRADITVDGLELTMVAEVHAQKDSGWYLPGPTDPLRIDSVLLNGVTTTQFRRAPGGLTAVRIPAGRHTVELVGRLANRNSATLQFDDKTRPKRVTFTSDDWTIDGLSSTGIPDSSLQLARTDDAQARNAQGIERAQELPPWYGVERFVALGIPWQIQTTITRTDASRSQLVKLPLMDGESVISDGPRVEGGQVLIDFSRDQESVEYISEIPVQEQVHLQAPTDQPWSETWVVECSRIWRCQFTGLPPIQIVGQDGVYRSTYKPWPAESLRIDVDRPAGVAGQSSTVDDVEYRVVLGDRILQANLRLTIRASEGGSQTITLPENAEIQETRINNEERSLRFEGGKLDLPIRPGSQTYLIRWQQPWELAITETMPAVDIGSEAVNVDLYMELGQKRWLLRTDGPSWGPAILFWPHLLTLLIIALLLSFLRGLPLKTHEWFLLVIGMSQLPYVALIPVVAWFAAMALRQKYIASDWVRFNLFQLFLIGTTLIATLILYFAIHTNLLFDIDTQVKGAQSSNHLLHWIIDRSEGQIGGASIIFVPMIFWRALMLGWAFWLVSRLLVWVPWGWKAFGTEGLWKGVPDKKRAGSPRASYKAPQATDGDTEAVSKTSSEQVAKEKPVEDSSDETTKVSEKIDDDEASDKDIK